MTTTSKKNTLNLLVFPKDINFIAQTEKNDLSNMVDNSTVPAPYCRVCGGSSGVLILNGGGNICEKCLEAETYRKMYTTMFNAATDAAEKIRDAEAILRKAQQKCEQIFMEAYEVY